jgi:glutamyl-tRNA(Gln) amidotransferase subunit E
VVEAHRGQKVGLEVLRQHCIEHDLAPADIGGLEEVIQGIVNDRLAFVQERGMGAMGPLMGTVMQAAGGADGKEVSALLRAAIQAVLE